MKLFCRIHPYIIGGLLKSIDFKDENIIIKRKGANIERCCVVKELSAFYDSSLLFLASIIGGFFYCAGATSTILAMSLELISENRNTTKSSKKLIITPTQKREILDIFQLFDTDGSGTMDVSELNVVFWALGFLPEPGYLLYNVAILRD